MKKAGRFIYGEQNRIPPITLLTVVAGIIRMNFA